MSPRPALPPLQLLATEPDPDFWLTDLGFARFEALVPSMEDPTWTMKVVNQEYTGPINKPLREQVLTQAALPEVAARHLLLVANFIERIRTIAIVEVATTLLSPEELESCSRGKDRWERAALALWIYLKAPRELLSVLICDRWNTRVRCVLKVKGRVPRPAQPLSAREVYAVAHALVERRRQNKTGKGELILLHAFSRKADEVLICFRRLHGLGTLRNEDNSLITGHNEELFILRFKDRAHRVDVTARRLDEATTLATLIGGVLLGQRIEYIKRRNPLTEQVLSRFLARACDPNADDLQLVEIKAEMPGERGRLVKTIYGSGQSRIEYSVQREAATSTFARDWRTVHSIKVLFEGYRFQIHFPVPGESLTLTYSDMRRDTGVSESLEEMIERLRDDFGADIRIVPRSQEVTKHEPRSRIPSAPRSMTYKHWRRLLSSTVDASEDWERGKLGQLYEQGLLSFRSAWFFRCGDPTIDRISAGVGESGLSCTGEIEWFSAQGDPLAEFGELSCPLCDTRWNLIAYRPPVQLRIHLTFHHAAVWRLARDKLSPFIEHLQEERPGIASGLHKGRRLYVVWLPLTSPQDAMFQAQGLPILWLSTVGDPYLSGRPGGDLAHLLTGRATIEDLLAMEGTTTPPPPSLPTARPAAPRLPQCGQLVWHDESIYFHAYRSASAMADGKPDQIWPVLAVQSHSSRLLLAILTDAAAEDPPGTRRYRTVSELLGRDPILTQNAKPEAFYKWVKRLRDQLDRAVAGLGEAIVESDEARHERGYRLGARYAVPTFHFSQEVQKWNSKTNNKG